MKLLTIAIPCYNSAAYMRKAIESLLYGGKEVEIIIVDDGSVKDETPAIADEYAERYPEIVKAIHQENGGHGEAVNAGLRNATGKFFKVVDSDDWVDIDAYDRILKFLRQTVEEEKNLDMLLSNYVYEKQGAKHKKVISYRNVFPVEKFFTWDEAKHFRTGQYILMHSVIYRTELLRACKLELPKHTFYVDNIFIYQPLPYVKDMYYLDVDFYRYFIGREDQSVNEKIMIGRIDMQYKVTNHMIESVDVMKLENENLKKYMISYLTVMMSICSILAIRSHEKENLLKKKKLWKHLKKNNEELYKKIRGSLLGRALNIPGPGGRKFAEISYKIAQKIYGFN